MHNKNIWSPWRYEYIRNLSEELNKASRASQSEGENKNLTSVGNVRVIPASLPTMWEQLTNA